MEFKNDKERLAFLDNYRNTDHGWYKWKSDEDLGRAWWRFDFQDCAIIVEEQMRTITWPTVHLGWSVVHWYIVEDWMLPFADSVASRTMALARLKEELKNGNKAG